jgi:formylglycine-generating enzyme required for sulfatase activity/dienelactone hydrolase
VGSRNCLRETSYAVSRDKELLSIHLEPTELSPGLALETGNRQAILKHKFAEDAYREKVSKALGELLSTSNLPNKTAGEFLKSPGTGSRPKPSGTPRNIPQKAATLLVILALAFTGFYFWQQHESEQASLATMQQARSSALKNISTLIEEDDYVVAYQQALAFESQYPEERLPEELWDELTRLATIITEPAGATLSYKIYDQVNDPWTQTGVTPLKDIRLPKGNLRIRLEKDGYMPQEMAVSNPSPTLGNFPRFPSEVVQLQKPETHTERQVYVPAGIFSPLYAGMQTGGVETFNLPPFIIDKFEVTNREFKEFVDADGYANPDYWQNLEFVEEGEIITETQAKAKFVDSTGKTGPATWELGSFPPGTEENPVTGVSWYECVAYARFRQMELPTIYHYSVAAYSFGEIILSFSTMVVPLSNFTGEPASVGEFQGLGPFGTYDMAGNAREWLWNQSGKHQWTLGGGWTDPPYMSKLAYTLPPMDRSPINGMRLMKNLGDAGSVTKLREPVPEAVRNFDREDPVSDEVYRVLAEEFEYPKTDLDPQVEYTREEQDWIREKVVINAAYEGQRFALHIFTPKQAGPYQTVVYFPGIDRFLAQMPSDMVQLESIALDLRFILGSGRALVWPVYWGSLERSQGSTALDADREPGQTRRDTLRWRYDLGRTLDYLETRDDFQENKFAYFGLSYGASLAMPSFTGESRFTTAILMSGGLWGGKLPTIADSFNYLPRIKQPVLMLTGRYDYIFDHENEQVPFFENLGTPAEHKKHVVYDAGHAPLPRNKMMREVADWLDLYLGPVN